MPYPTLVHDGIGYVHYDTFPYQQGIGDVNLSRARTMPEISGILHNDVFVYYPWEGAGSIIVHYHPRDDQWAGNFSRTRTTMPEIELPPDSRRSLMSSGDPMESSLPSTSPADSVSGGDEAEDKSGEDKSGGDEDNSGGEKIDGVDVEVDKNESDIWTVVTTVTATFGSVLMMAWLVVKALGGGTVRFFFSRTSKSKKKLSWKLPRKLLLVLSTLLVTMAITASFVVSSVVFFGGSGVDATSPSLPVWVAPEVAPPSPEVALPSLPAEVVPALPSATSIAIHLEHLNETLLAPGRPLATSTAMINLEQYGAAILTGDGHVVLNDDAIEVVLWRMLATESCLIDSAVSGIISPDQRRDLLDRCLEISEMVSNGGMTKDDASEHLRQAANAQRLARFFVIRGVRARFPLYSFPDMTLPYPFLWPFSYGSTGSSGDDSHPKRAGQRALA